VGQPPKTIAVSDGGTATQVDAGQAIAGDSSPFPWILTHDRRAELDEVATVTSSNSWEIQATATFVGPDDEVRCTGVGGLSLVVTPDRLWLHAGDTRTDLGPLSGPPLRARRLHATRLADGTHRLTITGQSQDIAWPFGAGPISLSAHGQAGLEALQLRSGPAPLTAVH